MLMGKQNKHVFLPSLFCLDICTRQQGKDTNNKKIYKKDVF